MLDNGIAHKTITNYPSGHIRMFLTCIIVVLINYSYYSSITSPGIKITDKTRGNSYSLLNKTNVCVYDTVTGAL